MTGKGKRQVRRDDRNEPGRADINTKNTYGWHFANATLRDGSPIPKDGVWLPPIKDIEICVHGYHGSLQPWDALKYAPGHTLCYCEFKGEIQHHDDKFVASQRLILLRMDAEELLFYFARTRALSVVHLWDAPDVVLDYLATGDKSLRAAAMDAAWDAAMDAARDAARAAARDAARAAARDAACPAARDAAMDAARNDFNAAVYECFESVVNPDGSHK